MTSVLIVDDEYLIRSLIRNSISWGKIEMEVIGEAGDGEEALTFIKACQPDIALVDINIPFLNGLELAQKIMEGQYRTKVILLTGYREFEYAKKAVQCRVSDYLLKPISAPELERSLLRLREEIRQDRNLHAQAMKNERQGDCGKKLMKNHFLHQLAFGRIRKSEVQIAAELERLAITLQPKGLQAMVVELEPRHQESEDGIYVYAVLNVLCELLRKKEHITAVEGLSEIDNCAIVLYNVAGEEKEVCAELRVVWAELTQTMEEHFQVILSAGVSNTFEGYGRAASAVHEAMEALSQKFYDSQERLFMAAEGIQSEGQKACFSSIDLEVLQIRMDAGEWEAGLHLIQSLFEKMREQRVQAEVVKITALGLITVLHSLVSRYQFPTEQLYSEGTLISRRIDQSDTCTEIERILTDYYRRLTEKIQMSCHISKIVYSAKAYIEEHYASEEISLKEIAATVFAAPAYVSSLFKKETGNSIIEYITICRMRRAAELLHQEPDLSLTAVSEQVGYTDPYYFSRCFKKYYGVTPSKFLASHLEKRRGSLEEEHLRNLPTKGGRLVSSDPAGP